MELGATIDVGCKWISKVGHLEVVEAASEFRVSLRLYVKLFRRAASHCLQRRDAYQRVVDGDLEGVNLLLKFGEIGGEGDLFLRALALLLSEEFFNASDRYLRLLTSL